MKTVSSDIKSAIASGTPIYAYAQVTLSSGTELTLTSQNDFFISGNSYTQNGTDGFALGDAICKSITLSIDNYSEKYSNYDFYKAVIKLYSEIDINNVAERFLEGEFTVIDSVSPGDVISITAYDEMYKADKKFESSLVYPTTALNLLQEVCTACDLTLDSRYLQFRNYDHVIPAKPESCTGRQVIGYIAQLAAGNALISTSSTLIIKSYADNDYSLKNIIDARNVKETVPNNISGGQLPDGNENILIQSGSVTSSSYRILSEFMESPQIGTDDITITGVEIEYRNSSGRNTIYRYGTDTYSIRITNPLIEKDIVSNIQSIIDDIGSILVGIVLRPFSGSFAPDPILEFMDPVFIVDLKYNIYQSIVFSHTFNYLGTSDISNDVPSPEKNGSVYSYNAADLYSAARTVANDRSDWEKAVSDLNSELQGIGGMYETTETLPDQSVIYYMHDKPNLSDSSLVIKINNTAIGISHTGVNGTYDTGISLVTGNVVVNQLNTIGLNADWVRTGTMSADRISGGTLQLGGVNNVSGELTVYNDQRTVIGEWGYDGLKSEVYILEDINSGVIRLCSSQEAHTSSGGIAIIEGTNHWFGVFGGSSTGVATDPLLVHGSGGWYFYKDITMSSYSNINLNGGNLSNAVATDLDISGSLDINNNTSVNIYTDVDQHNYTISNVKLSNLININGTAPKTGSINIVKDITVDSNGAVTNYTTGTLTFEDGILVGW